MMDSSRKTDFPVVGILGGGQLGRMTALAAIRMGVSIRFLIPEDASSVHGLGTVTISDWTDSNVLREFASTCDVVTAESEWAPVDILEPVLPSGSLLWPSAATIKAIRDKGTQKTILSQAGLPVPDFKRCTTLAEAYAAVQSFGYPALVKQYRGSYDGYGNETVRNEDELMAAWEKLAHADGALVERWVPFLRELAVLVARRADGERVVYPVAFTEQRDHRCHAVVVPAGVSESVGRIAEEIAVAAVEAVEGVGITAVELFELDDGQVLINELAPRPHNTGHYSIDACHTSQFENHVRAILGWPLGDPSLRDGAAVMVNILGSRSGTVQPNGLLEAAAIQGAAIHIYGKTEVRPNRKMGHVTVTGKDPVEARKRAEQAATFIRL